MVNVVATYKDGVGNLIHAIQWDGDTSTSGTWGNIQAWTKKATLSSKDQLRIQTPNLMLNVGVNDWMVMDNNHQPQVFPMSNAQFGATYVAGP